MTEIGAGDWLKQHIFQEKRRKLLAKKPKKQRPKTEKRKRTEKMNRALAETKKTMWNEHLWNERELPICKLCGKPIQFYEDCEICHESSRGMGSGKRNDSKVFLGHRNGNRAQASVSLAKYLQLPIEVRRKNCGVL